MHASEGTLPKNPETSECQRRGRSAVPASLKQEPTTGQAAAQGRKKVEKECIGFEQYFIVVSPLGK